jgi:hypothetical protein
MACKNPRNVRSVRWAQLFALFFAFMVANLCFAETNWWLDLQLRHELVTSIRGFFGGATGDYFKPNELVSSQILEGIGGPPKKAVNLHDGIRLLSASRPHSGDEKVAVVIDAKLNVLAAAVISFRCHYAETDNAGTKAQKNNVSPSPSCYPESKLTIFERGKPNAIVIAALLDWARSDTKDIQYEERLLK